MINTQPEIEAALVIWCAHFFDMDRINVTEDGADAFVANNPIAIVPEPSSVGDMCTEDIGHFSGKCKSIRQAGLINCVLREWHCGDRFTIDQP